MFGRRRLPHAVLFDMDGTLVDSEHYWVSSEKALAEEFNGTWTNDDGLSVVGMSLTDSSQVFKSKVETDLTAEQVVQRLTDSVSEQLAREVPWRPGAKELLLEIREAGIKTALVTMSLHRMAKQVVDSIDFDAFDVIIAGDDVRNGKPHPEPYLLAAERLGVDPKNCVAFEDSLSGLRSAEAAQTKAVGIPNIIPIEQIPGRILWDSLSGKTLRDLRKLF